MLYYIYCIKLHRSDEEFWCSSISKISKMIDIYADEQMVKTSSINGEEYESKYFNKSDTEKKDEPIEITSMSQIII